MPELAQWCFAEERETGDTTVLRSPHGVHILYYSGSTALNYEAAAADLIQKNLRELSVQAMKRYTPEITYSAITLTQGDSTVTARDILYPDIAHERFPEVPLYLQQDYPGTMYGGFELRTNGCGITSMAMLASYMADDELTPPEMCARYGRYSHKNGTDGLLFNNEPAVMGFYLREKTYDTRVVKKALEDGYLVVSIQHPGYWTRGGHYIVCESINEEGLIQVRDSNIYNYFNVRAHAQDVHTWGSITSAGSGYWIFEHKITRIPACSRCGTPDGLTQSLLKADYICEKCAPAILRRNTYLSAYKMRVISDSHFSYPFASFSRSPMVMPSKKSSIILSSLSHMGFAWQHSVREQAAAPWLVQETALKPPSVSFRMLPTV